MLNKKRTHSLRRAKYLLILPLALGLLLINNMNATARLLLEQLPAVLPVVSQPVEEPTLEMLPQQDDPIHNVVDVMPNFPGGESKMMEYLYKNVKYPLEAQRKSIEGRVIVSYVVEKDGSITNVQVVRSAEASLDKEAVRVVEAMPKWTPGKLKGEIVRVKYTLPVQYRLQPKQAESKPVQPTQAK